jgi:hypothetical protein
MRGVELFGGRDGGGDELRIRIEHELGGQLRNGVDIGRRGGLGVGVELGSQLRIRIDLGIGIGVGVG